MEGVSAGFVGGDDHETAGVHVVERNVHAGPVKEGGALAEVGRAAMLVDEIVGTCWDGKCVAHDDRAVERLHERRVPGCHLGAALLRDQRHGELAGFCGRMNGETDVSWKFDRNRVGKGLYWVS